MPEEAKSVPARDRLKVEAARQPNWQAPADHDAATLRENEKRATKSS